ncbi:MAG: Fe-S cluster assembly protein SufB, partial [Schleiferiaceae bacterium]|nr:Fe-S cluster assembly protein SufB [Schleiferiaceae bacterium]
MSDEILDEVTASEYKYGFVTDIESDTMAPGLNENVIRMISAKKNEPTWMLEWRLDAFKVWQDMKEPEWSNVTYKKPDFQAISYYSAPKQKKTLDSLDEVDPEPLKRFCSFRLMPNFSKVL